jgi:hypothetical protein
VFARIGSKSLPGPNTKKINQLSPKSFITLGPDLEKAEVKTSYLTSKM